MNEPTNSRDQLTKPVVLVLDDEKNIRTAIDIALSADGFHVLQAHDPETALRTLQERLVDVMVVDIQLGEIDGLAFFQKARSDGFDTPAIFMSGHATLAQAAQAVKIGGFDFLEKPFSAEKIAVTVRRCLEFSSIHQRLLKFEGQRHQIIGDSAAIQRLIADAQRVAGTNASVLIRGESGTGKELVASAIHGASPRAKEPFIKVNCSAIPENLIESELFGHERGAFTGAVAAKRGLFELANRGTIFLDEIGDLSPVAQAKILRVLQNGEIQKVGTERSLRVDVRVLSGTHKDLQQLVEEGRFREDLFYRLNVVPIAVPALRERVDDIPLLAHAFAKKVCEKNSLKEKTIDDDVLWELKRYNWPGNVRELQNLVERLVIMSGPRITVADLPEEIRATADDEPVVSAQLSLKEFRDRAEREFIIATLKKNSGNISQSATELGVGRTYLHKRLSALGIAKKDYFV